MFGDVVERKPVSIAFVKGVLEKIEEKNHEQKITFEYVSKFARISPEDAEKLAQELREANVPRMKERHIVKIVDILPKNLDELKAIFAKDELSLSKDDSQKILDILAKYR